jgi:hypothetical protein
LPRGALARRHKSSSLTISGPALRSLNLRQWFSFPNNISIDFAQCALTTGVDVQPPHAAEAEESTPGALSRVPFGGTRTFGVAAGSSTTFRLVCVGLGQNISVLWPVLNAVFIAGS